VNIAMIFDMSKNDVVVRLNWSQKSHSLECVGRAIGKNHRQSFLIQTLILYA
jgi:hypothetical protein